MCRSWVPHFHIWFALTLSGRLSSSSINKKAIEPGLKKSWKTMKVQAARNTAQSCLMRSLARKLLSLLLVTAHHYHSHGHHDQYWIQNAATMEPCNIIQGTMATGTARHPSHSHLFTLQALDSIPWWGHGMDQAYSFVHFIAAKELGKGISASLQLAGDSLQVGKLCGCQVANHSNIHYGLLLCILCV